MQSVCCTHDIGPLLGALIGTLLCPVPGVSTLVAEIYWFCSVHYVTGHVRVQERKYFIDFFFGLVVAADRYPSAQTHNF